ncbi:phosphoribosylglycinamide formyltransferase [Microbulbifer thermotolerans]|uniref:Phosphoribosylglycinamide formyltransferase n=1 Tax=Microbulbifer thermotolerans TaxID=252514 RepID=A0AB35HZ73_MICTH|nr:phosphoribosylglycinamide formyltransferase [Microbulbifer thermotolerans]MCX2779912.1 phosphoribosylglycinamide formyltransferase [Microbulbifer thermotolerans]MCX2781569.1 phosphoribosylglycinamide formyltransferase [Microbulbifer thermotolerans]MCX2794727.1 phosphoribosylglycinamide formyltransferase [Microbulbifer thermotolerans]MCX2802794.1 phosphoribosylglycinamide formyltransferase [Microbulbifer thermotolerans]MCX2805219.1 phosphoribosylglycinamide formyltransferase [Microbulbifer t
MTGSKCKTVVLISGSGTNLQALIDTAASEGAEFSVCAVISNKSDAYGLIRASDAGIATSVVNHRDFDDRGSFDRALMEEIDRHQPDLVVLAGFMRILTPEFVRHYKGRLLNIHPSLLPKYQGLHTHKRALEAGDDEHGATVHFVTEELDGGPAIVQAVVPIETGDTPERLAERVQVQEHVIYPLAVTWFAQGRLRMMGDQAELDGEILPRSGKKITS